jgi:hypothetical protein
MNGAHGNSVALYDMYAPGYGNNRKEDFSDDSHGAGYRAVEGVANSNLRKSIERIHLDLPGRGLSNGTVASDALISDRLRAGPGDMGLEKTPLRLESIGNLSDLQRDKKLLRELYKLQRDIARIMQVLKRRCKEAHRELELSTGSQSSDSTNDSIQSDDSDRKNCLQADKTEAPSIAEKKPTRSDRGISLRQETAGECVSEPGEGRDIAQGSVGR